MIRKVAQTFYSGLGMALRESYNRVCWDLGEHDKHFLVIQATMAIMNNKIALVMFGCVDESMTDQKVITEYLNTNPTQVQ